MTEFSKEEIAEAMNILTQAGADPELLAGIMQAAEAVGERKTEVRASLLEALDLYDAIVEEGGSVTTSAVVFLARRMNEDGEEVLKTNAVFGGNDDIMILQGMFSRLNWQLNDLDRWRDEDE